MADVEEVEVVVAHNERATLRVGDVFLKIDADQTRTDVEVEAMAMAPVPTPEVLWRKPPVLALAAVPGTALGRLGEPSAASPAAWAAAGAAARKLHDAPLPPWPGPGLDEIASELDGECEWLVANGVLPPDLVRRNRQVAEAALRPWTTPFWIRQRACGCGGQRFGGPGRYRCRTGSRAPGTSRWRWGA